MAVGDYVIQMGADNASFTFQPAVGVVVLITAVGLNDYGSAWFISTNGTLESFVGNNSSVVPNNQGNMKVFIDNTYYMRLRAVGVGAGSFLTGIQVA